HRKIKPHTSRSQRDRHAHVADRRINTPTAALQPRSAHGLNGYNHPAVVLEDVVAPLMSSGKDERHFHKTS
ncbi:MAG: hypothetical protein ACRDRR_07340, partial [Pseudonocardiaceae bacterium]